MIESTTLALPLAHHNATGLRCARAGTLLQSASPVPYVTAWELQSRLHRERASGLTPDTVAILEHHPVYTFGRSTRPADWLGTDQTLGTLGADLVRVNRGGAITFHGPGQIVVYPILKVTDYATGPRLFVRLLEEVIIQLLARWGIEGRRIDKKPGVWVMTPQPAKIASVGIRIERGISLHGFALNADLDLAPFQYIHPCGLTDCRMTSMRDLGNSDFSLNTVKHNLADIFSEVFAIEWATVTDIPVDRFTKDYDPVHEGVCHIK
ncbi:MAG: lipoyl(octanoyl) transferase LipB [Nitrospira sp.]|nr:lipoyl(octanoyl) transferase LipB [Nitrospira sp.]